MRLPGRWLCLVALLLPFAFLHMAPIQSSSGGAAQDETSIARIGTWNIEWLGRPEKRGDIDKDIPQSPADIAKYIIASKVDILALNEISHDGESIDPPTNKTLTEALSLVKKETGKTWKHMLFPKDDRN